MTSERELLFVKLHWDTKPIKPSLLYFEVGNPELKKMELEVGMDINLKFGSQMLCIGSELERGEWVSCLVNNDSTKERPVSSKQCSTCKGSNFFDCRMTCTGEVCTPSSEEAFNYCKPANTGVYLTLIGDIRKVGVSLGVKRRFLEQGSDYGVEIARLPGLEARKLEHELAKALDLRLQVRNTYKMKNLVPKKLEEAEEILNEKMEQAEPITRTIISGMQDRIELDILDNEIHNLKQHYGDLEIDKDITEIKAEPDNEFGGKLVGIKGSILVVKQEPYYYFALNTRTLISRTFTFLDRQAELEKQTDLDEWF